MTPAARAMATGAAPPHRPRTPTAFFLDSPLGGQRLCLFHAPPPGIAPRGRVLFCPPFAEELNTTRRTVAGQARALAEAGFAVLQIDLLGCGDSSGDFADATWPAWLADLQQAHAWLARHHPDAGPLWLWGLRAGALLASDLAAALPAPAHLLLWQPFVGGQQQLQQFLRLHSAGRWLAGEPTNAVKKPDTPAQQLAQGQPVHIAGYWLSPLLAQGLAAAQLQPPAHRPPGRLIWLELGTQHAPGPAADRHMAAWRQAGWQVSAPTVVTPAFWQTVDTEAAPPLMAATLAALSATQASAGDATGAEGAADVGQTSHNTRPTGPAEPPGADQRAPAMSVVERALAIPGPHTDMLGILSLPLGAPPTSPLGVVLVVGGAQYRVGSHRQFVLLARHLAAHGHPVLRFDFPGMGDSPGDRVAFEDTAPHISAAIDHLQTACAGVQRVVLWGLCDGASASLLHWDATQDPRVAGLALLNPWVRSDASLARAQVKHYYRQRLLQPAFWRKLLAGGVGWQALRSLGGQLRTMRRPTAPASACFQDRMARAWRAFPGPILLLLSQHDLSAQEFQDTQRGSAAWARHAPHPAVTPIALLGADHTCSQPAAQARNEAEVLAWMQRLG